MDTIGERVLTLRTQRGITQKKLADEIGLRQSNVGSLENNDYKPSANTIMKLSQFFNVSADWLLSGGEFKSDLIEKERDILNRFRAMSDIQKNAIYEIVKSINTEQ